MEDDDEAVRDILEGGDHNVHQLPDFADDEDDMMDHENADLAMGNMIPPEDSEDGYGSGGAHQIVHGEDENETDIHELLKNADENELYR